MSADEPRPHSVPPPPPGHPVAEPAAAAQLPAETAAGITGDGPNPAERAIAAAMAGLDDLEQLPTAQHVAAFERVHTALSEALSSIDGV